MNCSDCKFYSEIFWKCSKTNRIIKPDEPLNNCKIGERQVKKQQNSEPRKIPKGIEIRNNKRKKNNAKMRKTKPGQESICRFVWIEYLIFHKVNGNTKPYKTVGNLGLQIGNKVYLNDGKYKFVNNKNLKIKKKYDGIPDGASKLLADKYILNK